MRTTIKTLLVLAITAMAVQSADAQFRPTRKQGGGRSQSSHSWVAGTPSRSTTVKTPAVPENRVSLLVKLTNPEATLSIQDQATTAVGLQRQFLSPELDAGKTYTYTLVAAWKEGGKDVRDVRKVEFKPGSSLVVDFTKPAPTESLPVTTKTNNPR